MFGWYWNVLAVSSKIACVYVVCTFTLWMTLCLYISVFVNTDAYKREKHNVLPLYEEKVSFPWAGNGHIGCSKVMTVLCRVLQMWNLYNNMLFLTVIFTGEKERKNYYNTLYRIKIHIETACWVSWYVKSFSAHIDRVQPREKFFSICMTCFL